MTSIAGQRLSRDDWKKAKELEELRKTGAAPPELDEDGKMINPHIPQYISAAPWYLNQSRPGLKHQRTSHFAAQQSFAGLDQFYPRGQKRGRADKWIKGACENCGARTHKTKDCCERPRARGAKLTNQDIAPDEVIAELRFDYEGKRDRWAGYDPATYQKVIEQHERIEAERRAHKKKEVDQLYQDPAQRKADKLVRREERARRREERSAKRAAGEEVDSDGAATDTDSDTDSDDDELEDLKDTGKLIQKRDENTRTTVRNLRIREDTAKYLRNLNVNSAHYDPKTRSMRENPYGDKDPSEVMYAGDNFIRSSGDVAQIRKLQSYVWEAAERTSEQVVLEANPSAAEHMYKQFMEKKKQLKVDKKAAVLEKYGGAEHLEAPAPELLLNQSEAYVEYSEDGKVVRGQEKAIPKSKWAEDQLESNHSEIYGSWYETETGKWGYKCCHQTLRNAYCTGKAGLEVASEMKTLLHQRPATSSASSSAAASKEQEELNEDRDSDEGDADLRDSRPTKRQKLERSSDKKKKRRKSRHSDSSDSSGSDSDEEEERRKERARREARKRAILEASRAVKAGSSSSSSSSSSAAAPPRPGYGGMAPSPAEMEAYMRNKARADDPMAKFAGGIEDEVD